MLRVWIAAIVGGVALLGCGLQDGPYDTPTSIEVANRIVGDDDLSPQEKREQLRDMGFDDLAINALLRDETNGNQFGGDLSSAFNKVSGGRFTELTPDEVQIYAEAVGTADPNSSFNISDAAAQQAVTLFVDNNLNTAGELEAFLGDPANEVPGEIPDGALEAIFVEFDPNEVVSQLP